MSLGSRHLCHIHTIPHNRSILHLPSSILHPPILPFPPPCDTLFAMRCPFCDADKESLKVIDSRTCEGGRAIRRRRQCLQCSKRFTTYERIEDSMKLTVIKKDGTRVPFDRTKILTGLERATYKRPVQADDLQRIIDEIEEEIQKHHDKEVPSSAIGEMVIERLRHLDQVAYVRFASVYRRFKTLDELVAEARAVIDAHQHDVPGQGRLFGESAAVAPSNGDQAAPAAKKPRAAKAAQVSPQASS
jgi:transcriptional repressor NrdR